VLVADDDLFVLRRIEEYLLSWGYRPLLAPTKADVFAHLNTEKPVMTIVDLQFGETDGLELLTQLMSRDPESTIAVLTGSGSIDKAVQAIKLGACDFLTKPADQERLRSLITFAVKKNKLDRESTAKFQAQDRKQQIGNSVEYQKAMQVLRSVANTDATVLITGESGTGKEMAAQSVHTWSQRCNSPFVALNMATLPRDLAESLLFGHEKGSFTGADKAQIGACEQANGGTLFLDEIGELEISQQAKLLRFLQERTIQRVGSSRMISLDVRIIAATNRDLPERVREGLFREDLYFRLNVVPVSLPALRNRREDIPLLATLFLARAAAKYNKPDLSLCPELLEIMIAYDWPGNIRQLENTMERMAILSAGPIIDAEEYKSEFCPKVSLATASDPSLTLNISQLKSGFNDSSSCLRYMDRVEKESIENALVSTHGNVSQAAQLLGMSQATVYRKLKRYKTTSTELKS
jgi:DNA-binding NtrC family response regulator